MDCATCKQLRADVERLEHHEEAIVQALYGDLARLPHSEYEVEVGERARAGRRGECTSGPYPAPSYSLAGGLVLRGF